MATADTSGLTVKISPGTDDWEERDRTTRLSDHFAKVSARYGTLRELDLDAVRIIGNVVARAAADPGRPVRLVDVADASADAVGRLDEQIILDVGQAAVHVQFAPLENQVAGFQFTAGIDEDLGVRHPVVPYRGRGA